MIAGGADLPFFHRLPYRTAGVACVSAIGKAAMWNEALEFPVAEGQLRRVDACQAKYHHSRRVDEVAAFGQMEQPGAGGGVAPAVPAGGQLADPDGLVGNKGFQ